MFDDEFAGVFDPSRQRPERRRLGSALACLGIAGKTVEHGPFAIAGAGIIETDNGLIVKAGRLRDRQAGRAETRDVLSRWARSGEIGLRTYEGDFALACWDQNGRHGLLAQDQLGGRSLFVASLGASIAFATEVRLLLEVLSRTPGPDETALAHWLADRGVYHGRTLYEGIVRVQGGRCLRLGPGAQMTWSQWWFPAPGSIMTGSKAELGATLIDAVDRAVAAEIEPGSVRGVLLSGGLDSSVVAATAARAAGRRGARLHAFSATFPDDPELDETRWAGAVTDHCGLELNRVEVTQGAPLRLLSEWIDVWRVPLLSPGLMIERPLLDAARAAGARVVLDGQGGDELFAAPGFVLSDLLRAGRVPSLVRLTRRYPGLVNPSDPRRLARVWRQVALPGAIPYCWHGRRERRRRFPSDPRWMAERLARLRFDAIDPWAWKRGDGPIWWRALSDNLTEQREHSDIADYLRRRAALSGVRGVSPLLSLSLVETTLRLPPGLGFDPLWTRAVIRHSSAGLLPDAARYRRGKADFSELYLRALTRPESMAAVDKLIGAGSELSGYLDMSRVRAAVWDGGIPSGRAARHDWLVQVWNLLSAEQWLRSLSRR